MAEAGGRLSDADLQTLLEGIDTAFEQVVHGRFGGGIEVSILVNADEETVQILRMPGAGTADCLRLLLQPPGSRNAPSTGRGVMVGRVTMLAPPSRSIGDIAILTEIYDTRDANEASDATYFGTGMVFAEMPDQSGGGLGVVRSTEAASQSGRQGTRQQRGWLPQQHRNNPSRALGLGGNGHRRSPVAGVSLPVSGDLLGRIGAVVAGLGPAGEPKVGAMSLVVETNGSAMP